MNKRRIRNIVSLGVVALSLCSFSLQSVADKSNRDSPPACSDNVWSNVNTLIGMIPGIGSIGSYISTLSGLAKDAVCVGEGMDEGRVTEIAHDVTHNAFRAATINKLTRLSISLDSMDKNNSVDVEKLKNAKGLALNVGAEIGSMDYRTLDLSVSVEAMQLGIFNTLMSIAKKKNDHDKLRELDYERRLQAAEAFGYLTEKERSLRDYIDNKLESYIESKNGRVLWSNLNDEFEVTRKHRGVVKFRDGTKVYTRWKNCPLRENGNCVKQKNAVDRARFFLKIDQGNRIRNAIVNKEFKNLRHKLLALATGGGHAKRLKVSNFICLNPNQYGHAVETWLCNRRNKQKWTLVGGMLVNGQGLCLDVAGSIRKNGNPVVTWACHGKKRQQWRLRQGTLVNSGGLCLNAHNANEIGGRISIWTCNGGSNQLWEWDKK